MKYINIKSKSEFLIDKDNCPDVVAAIVDATNFNTELRTAQLVGERLDEVMLDVDAVRDGILATNYYDVIVATADHPYFQPLNTETHQLVWEGRDCSKVAFTVEELADKSASKAQQDANKEALSYLSSTDWYVIRKQETGVDIPPDILIARQAARDSII